MNGPFNLTSAVLPSHPCRGPDQTVPAGPAPAAAAGPSSNFSQQKRNGTQKERSHLPQGAPTPCNAMPCAQPTTAGVASLKLLPNRQRQQPHHSKDCRISVPRKDLRPLIGENPKLPLQMMLRISVQGIVQEGEQRVRWGGSFLRSGSRCCCVGTTLRHIALSEESELYMLILRHRSRTTARSTLWWWSGSPCSPRSSCTPRMGGAWGTWLRASLCASSWISSPAPGLPQCRQNRGACRARPPALTCLPLFVVRERRTPLRRARRRGFPARRVCRAQARGGWRRRSSRGQPKSPTK